MRLLCVTLFLFAVSGCGTRDARVPVEQAAPTAQRYTIGQYNQLQEGMNYKEACRIMGSAGEQTSDASGQTEGRSWQVSTYVWPNKDNTNVQAVFKDDKLTYKQQMGLQ